MPHPRPIVALLVLALAATACGDARSDPSEITPIEIAASGYVFDARVAGPSNGTPVLLLHGFPESSFEWRVELAALGAAGFRAVAPDLRGYSPRARPLEVDAYRLDRLAADVFAMADALDFQTFHVVGHDWGASIGWQAAILHPERLRSLTAVSVPHPAAFAEALATDPEQQRMSGYITFFQQPGVAENALLANDAQALRAVYGTGPASEGADEYVRLLSEPGALTAALDYYRALDPGVSRYDHVRVPTLYVWSTNDVTLGRTGAKATTKYVDGPYRFEIIEGVSHWVPEDAADRLTALVREQLAAFP
jgi:pimeloyl-ACP methyl ester carboxylesterase